MDKKIKYSGNCFSTANFQSFLSIGYPKTRDILDRLIIEGSIIVVKRGQYIFKEQVKENYFKELM